MSFHLVRMRQSPTMLSRWVGRDILLAHPRRQEFDLLSGTSVAIWRLLETPMTMREIVERLEDIYGGARGTIASDVGALLDELVRRGAVEEIIEEDV